MTKKPSKTKSNKFSSIIGKQVIVRSTVAGVHFGSVKEFDPASQSVLLTNAYRLWRVYTRDTTGSISDIAANGLKEPLSKQSIGARLDEVLIVNPAGLEIAVCAACVEATIRAAAPENK